MRAVLILRHGETTWNVAGRWQGWIDVELAAAGEQQAAARGALLADSGIAFAAIISSDLRRAAQTAEVIRASVGAPDVVLDAGLRERHGGEFEGLDAAAIDAGWPGFRDRWRAGLEDAPPGGESDADVWKRVHDVLARLDSIDDGPVLLVTHGGVARIVSDRADAPTRSVLPNVGGRWFDWDGTRLHAGAHLDPLPDTDHTKPAIE
jgi:broad specificity phosphatase PhoE